MSPAVANILAEFGFWIALTICIVTALAILAKRLLCWIGSVVAGWFFGQL